jgi:glycosyltransferase involved in cell wall biosynthesis
LQNVENHFRSGQWFPAAGTDRSFVKYPHPQVSRGQVFQYPPGRSSVILSIAIPTVDANRDGYFLKLLAQIGYQDFIDSEVIVVRGDPLQGRAINTAAALARGKYLLTLDDDTSLPDPMTFQKLFAAMESNPDIGIAGGNNVVPANAKSFVRCVMRELPRRSWDPVQEIIDSDLAEHPCMIMRVEDFKLIGGENELIPRGLDPYLRQQFRKLQKRVVIVPGVIYHHLPPDNFSKLLLQFYRNGRQAAFTHRNYPQWMIETPQKHGDFKEKQSFLFRVARFPLRLLQALVTAKPIWFMCEVFYALGFAGESIFLLRRHHDP